MKVFKLSVLVIFVLMAALAVLARPAFATPRLTASTGSSPVAPFITPIGNTTTSTVSGSSSDSRFSSTAPFGVIVTISCTDSRTTGYVPTTHTRANVTSLTFTTCRSSIGGNVTFTTTASSASPWLLHVRSGPDGAGSSTGTIEIPAGGRANIRIDNPRCTITITPQSIENSFTNANTSMFTADGGVAFTLAAGDSALCPSARTPATLSGTYTLRPATARDDIRITAAS